MGLFDIFSSVKQHTVSQEELVEAVKNTETLVIDVRAFLEYKQSHLTPCHNVDFKADDFEEKITKYDKKRPYILICKSDARSKKALKKMLELGFSNVGYLAGGMDQWTLQKRLK